MDALNFRGNVRPRSEVSFAFSTDDNRGLFKAITKYSRHRNNKMNYGVSLIEYFQLVYVRVTYNLSKHDNFTKKEGNSSHKTGWANGAFYCKIVK